MKTINRLLLITLLLLPNLVFAASESSGVGKITSLNLAANGAILKVTFSQPYVNPGNCGAANAYIRELDDSPVNQRFYSTALAAYIAKKDVKFWIDDCTTNPWWTDTYPRIWGIEIID
ncbi:MAG: hypothetical protein KDK66_02740 [Deltaproteobacteria bacterium]|nr:hypothetical protein [Deltaproteobacteria bacterium]